jgi:hypothetical protein
MAKNPWLEKASWVGTIVGVILAFIALVVVFYPPNTPSPPAPVSQQAGNNNIQIEHATGPIIIYSSNIPPLQDKATPEEKKVGQVRLMTVSFSFITAAQAE